MSKPEDKSLFFPIPKEITEFILSQSSLLTKDPVTFRLLEKESKGFSHLFWKKMVYSLFPHITVYNPPSKTATSEEETKFFKSLIAKTGALFIESIKNPELKKLYRAIFRDDLVRVKALLNNPGFDKTNVLAFSDAIRTKELLLPELSPASLAGALGRKEILSAFYASATDNGTQINLWWACALNQYALVKQKAAEITDWNQPGLYYATPLWIACKNGHLDVVKTLIQAGVDVNKACIGDITPLWIACLQGHLDVVEALIQAGVDVNDVTALYMACQNGHLRVVNVLIQAGFDVNEACTDDITPLWIACDNGHLDVVKTLIQAGADVNKPCTYNGTTPLWIACRKGYLDVAKALITGSADVNKACTYDGTTPRFIVWEKDGSTPLYIACQQGYLDVVKVLIQAGADVTKACTDDGATPHDVARHNSHTEIARLLEARAQMNTLDESSVLEQFRHYASKFNKQFYLAPLLRFFYSSIYNPLADIIQQAFLQEKKPSLNDFLGKLKTIAAEKNIDLRAYRSGELNALLNLSEMVLGEPFETLKPAGNAETQAHNLPVASHGPSLALA
ncbi:ankyrin repeat domain-containing protein [Legionella erythra]|uniref:Ankyrin repeat protein n=1 Tax=Legionella erythra TaxID=448 RepID=A0A0W0TR82_LEGER|nr:ankyrin repeat domain-containing protein [Legionella erythra]KTC98145.1 Ankyrin repeat protein [Legionella erythra]